MDTVDAAHLWGTASRNITSKLVARSRSWFQHHQTHDESGSGRARAVAQQVEKSRHVNDDETSYGSTYSELTNCVLLTGASGRRIRPTVWSYTLSAGRRHRTSRRGPSSLFVNLDGDVAWGRLGTRGESVVAVRAT